MFFFGYLFLDFSIIHDLERLLLFFDVGSVELVFDLFALVIELYLCMDSVLLLFVIG